MSAHIHPTAIIDDQVQLADEVHIGSGCILQGPVRLGAGTRLLAAVHIHGPVTIGEGNTLYPHVCIGYPPQHRKYPPGTPTAGVVLGHDNVLREGVTLHAATGNQPTTLGDRNYLMANSHVGHDARLGHDITLANGAMIGGHAVIGDHVTLGGNAGVHQFCRVGRLAMLTGNGGITQDLPPFCVSYTLRTVSSLNLVGLRRAGLRDHIRPLKQAFDLLYRRGYSNQTALKLIHEQLGHDPLCRELADFVRCAKRGITRYARHGGSEGEEA